MKRKNRQNWSRLAALAIVLAILSTTVVQMAAAQTPTPTVTPSLGQWKTLYVDSSITGYGPIVICGYPDEEGIISITFSLVSNVGVFPSYPYYEVNITQEENLVNYTFSGLEEWWESRCFRASGFGQLDIKPEQGNKFEWGPDGKDLGVSFEPLPIPIPNPQLDNLPFKLFWGRMWPDGLHAQSQVGRNSHWYKIPLSIIPVPEKDGFEDEKAYIILIEEEKVTGAWQDDRESDYFSLWQLREKEVLEGTPTEEERPFGKTTFVFPFSDQWDLTMNGIDFAWVDKVAADEDMEVHLSQELREGTTDATLYITGTGTITATGAIWCFPYSPYGPTESVELGAYTFDVNSSEEIYIGPWEVGVYARSLKIEDEMAYSGVCGRYASAKGKGKLLIIGKPELQLGGWAPLPMELVPETTKISTPLPTTTSTPMPTNTPTSTPSPTVTPTSTPTPTPEPTYIPFPVPQPEPAPVPVSAKFPPLMAILVAVMLVGGVLVTIFLVLSRRR